MKTYMLLTVLLLFAGCKHFEARHSTDTGTERFCKPACTNAEVDELAEPIF